MRRIPGKEYMSLFVNTHNYSSTYAKATEKDGITRVDTESYNATDVVGTLVAAAVIGFGVRAGSVVFDKATEVLPAIARKATDFIGNKVDLKFCKNGSIISVEKPDDPNAKEGIDDEDDLDD